MALASITAPLAALTTIFQPPCETSWFITTTKVPSQDPPFPTAGPVTCDPPQWAANLEDPGFQYYSPAICPSGFAVGPKCEVRNPRTNEGFPPIAAGETAVYCVPSGFTCTSDTTDFRGGVWGVAGNTNGPPNRILVTVAPAMQIRWRDVDLDFLQTHPLTPGLLPLTPAEPEPTSTIAEPTTAAQVTPPPPPPPTPPGQVPTITLGSTQLERTDSVIILTSTAAPENPPVSSPQPQPSTVLQPSSRSTTNQGVTQSTSTKPQISNGGTALTSNSQATSISTGSSLPDGGSMPAGEGGGRWDWRTGIIAMVLSALLVTIGVVAFGCILLRRNKPNDPWSKFLRSPPGILLAKWWDLLAASTLGMWVKARAAQAGKSRAGVWVRQRWDAVRPARPSPTKSPSKKEMDLELGMSMTPTVAELDANQRLGSPGNPAELDGGSRWSSLGWSRSSGSSASFGVVNRVKTWLITTAQPAARWTRSGTPFRIDNTAGGDRPYSFRSSRPTSEKSGFDLRASADWDNFSPATLKVPTAAHITRAHERNNSLADVLDSNAKARATNDAHIPESGRLAVPGTAQTTGEDHESTIEAMNRLSAGTFGAGRASQIIESQSMGREPVPALPPKTDS